MINLILITSIYLIIALLLSYLFIYPYPKKMVVQWLKKKITNMGLLTQTGFLVLIPLLVTITIIATYFRYETTEMSLQEWLGLLAFGLLWFIIYLFNQMYKQLIQKKLVHLQTSTTDYQFARKKKRIHSFFYIALVVVHIIVIGVNIVVSLDQLTISIINLVTICLFSSIIFVYLFYFFGVLDTYTELSNLEKIKIERTNDSVEGIIFLETKEELFIKQLDTSEIIIINKQMTDIISYTK